MRQNQTSIAVGRILAEPGRHPAGGPARLAFADGRIAEVAAVDAASLAPHERGLLALPALANAHDHGRGLKTLAYGALDDLLEVWLTALGQEPRVDPYLRAAAAFGRLAEGGIAAANHCHNTQDPAALVAEAEAVSAAARDVGVRIAFAVPIHDRNPVVYGDVAPLMEGLPAPARERLAAREGRAMSVRAALDAVEAIAAFEHETFHVQYGPVGPQWVSDAALAAIAEASAANGRRIHMHLYETRFQKEWAEAAYPHGLLRHLDAIGLLSPRLTVAHGVWLDEADCALLAERGVTVSVNTSSNLRLRSGIAPVKRYVGAGLRFAMGLDGMAFDDDEDGFREMRLLWHHQRGFAGDGVLAAADLFEAVIANGRRTVVGDDGGGGLTAGAPGDVAIVDYAAMADDVLREAADPIDVILTRASKHHLKRFIVGGRTIVADGRCVSVDLDGIGAALRDQARAGWARNPPDAETTGVLREAMRRYYVCGCHRTISERQLVAS